MDLRRSRSNEIAKHRCGQSGLGSACQGRRADCPGAVNLDEGGVVFASRGHMRGPGMKLQLLQPMLPFYS